MKRSGNGLPGKRFHSLINTGESGQTARAIGIGPRAIMTEVPSRLSCTRMERKSSLSMEQEQEKRDIYAALNEKSRGSVLSTSNLSQFPSAVRAV